MIVSSEGSSHSKSTVGSAATKIVCTTGTAYAKTTRVKSCIRFIKKTTRKIVKPFRTIHEFFCHLVYKNDTSSGEPTSLAPPMKMKERFKG